MADILKVLGQSSPAALVPTTLYTVPSQTVTTTSSLIICNRGGTSGTFRIAVRPGGETLANKHYLYYDASLGANNTQVSVLGLTLSETDVVTVYASSTNFSFSIYGVETNGE